MTMSEHETRLLTLIAEIEADQLFILRHILHALESKTPKEISFKEITPMAVLPPVAGNTLVFTGTLTPANSQFSAGTSFSVTSSDTTVTPTVDATGLIVTIPLPAGFVDDPANPLTVTYTASGITPNPATSPTSITATITPTVPALTPTGISFAQTT